MEEINSINFMQMKKEKDFTDGKVRTRSQTNITVCKNRDAEGGV